MTIAIRNTGTGEVHIVETLDHYGGEWTALSDADYLAMLRAQRWGEVRAARDVAKFGGCETPFGRVDTAPESLILANGASSAAMAAAAAGEAFAIGWTMEDNSTVDLDGAQMIAVGVAMAQHIGACHALGVTKRAAIDAAATADDIAAVSLDGWP